MPFGTFTAQSLHERNVAGRRNGTICFLVPTHSTYPLLEPPFTKSLTKSAYKAKSMITIRPTVEYPAQTTKGRTFTGKRSVSSNRTNGSIRMVWHSSVTAPSTWMCFALFGTSTTRRSLQRKVVCQRNGTFRFLVPKKRNIQLSAYS